MKSLQLLFLVATFTLSGCVVGTRNIDLAVPAYDSGQSASGTVYINTVTDNRVFEQQPSNPSTPSVDGNLSSTPKAKLATLIGRQRNGFGKAMGDVALPKGMTVEDKVRELLTQALASRGYEVVDDKNAPNQISVDIEKFWGWFTPGMWAISFEANLQCNIDFAGPGAKRTFDVTGYGINKGQIASDENWQLAYQRAYENFLQNLDAVLDESGL